jgi:uncharacterized protein
MQTRFIDKKINYDGAQLKPLYAYLNHQVKGHSVIAFTGACDVSFEHMVDMEDLVELSPIKSDNMLHLIVEIFDSSLLAAVSLQRLLASIIQSALFEKTGKTVVREGDDIYWEGKKLSVSIASRSAVSLMIHFGMNIDNTGTPVLTCCLKDFGLDAKSFANEVMRLFAAEFDSILEATQKVKPL